MSETLTFNGIDGTTGEYLLPEMTAEQISRVAQGETLDRAHLSELRHRHLAAGLVHLGVKEGVDPKDLSQAGWGVIFAHADGEEVDRRREALKPLLDLRREQAGNLYREFSGADAYRPGESKRDFLARHGVGPGPADPDRVPYYLLIVAGPESVPYRVQYQLDVQYAVGRIHFPSLDEYAAYAESVVAAEKGQVRRGKTAVFFGVRNAGDKATQLSADHLVRPLAETMAEDQPAWAVKTRIKNECFKADLATVLADPGKPALLFTASHGMGFPKDDPRQLPHQGALLCQDWPGPLQWMGKPIPPEHYFSGDDLGAEARLGGLIAFHFACYGAGTPDLDDFAHEAFQERKEIAPHPFVARLPQKLLGHPGGGALAVVGHVERAWTFSFLWAKAGPQLEVFRSMLKRLMEGHPVGSAMEFFDERYAELSTDLSSELEEIKFGKQPDDLDLAGMWTANNDARSYAIIGDPAVRLAV